ncbi:hypothetical protein EJ110_NYTH03137 [Nymphaea thermarum]|nr:hypothetical protein EJ110_NYTH03137 [Nymphaea thermarum]
MRPPCLGPRSHPTAETEACKGFLGPLSAKAEGSLTARPTRRARTKVGLSDPTVPSGRAELLLEVVAEMKLIGENLDEGSVNIVVWDITVMTLESDEVGKESETFSAFYTSR